MTKARRRWIAAVAVAGLVATVAVDHARHRDVRATYDHQPVMVAAVPSGDTVRLTDGTVVRLLGVRDPSAAAPAYVAERVRGRPVTLLLPAVGATDADGRVAAYAYVGPACLNVELVKLGLARFDRRRPVVLAGLLGPAEADARRHGRGVWAAKPLAEGIR